LPQRTRDGDAGYDLRCVASFEIAPRGRTVVGTGLSVALPAGVAGLVLPRSGLAATDGVSVANAPGLIDPSYRGEIRVILANFSDEPFLASADDRIAQLLLVPFWSPTLSSVDELPPGEDDRGENGLGSSGR
jgi:dUTP pyrophosphatase